VKRLGPSFPVDVHFAPRYNPWDERLCIIPDGDLYRALQQGGASIVTDQIVRFDATGIQLASGQHLEADIIVTATGLRMALLSGVTITVDGAPFDMTQQLVYKGLMLSNLPNFAMSVGYTNASWTLKADLIAQHVCRLLRYLHAHGYTQVTPRRDPRMPGAPVFNFTSGYVQRANAHLPQQGATAPWRLYQNYLKDLVMLRYGRVDDPALEFRAPASLRQQDAA
jgi:cation diffusion facilitator CzcD-associated flavoprotein CzcO